MRDYEKRGRWWRPEMPDDEVAGTLRCANQTGIALELDGVFPGGGEGADAARATPPILVNGVTEDGSLVTPVDAQRAGSVRSMVGYDRVSCSPDS